MCNERTADGGCRDAETDPPRMLPDERKLSGELDTAFELLANQERRSIVASLVAGDGQTATVPELACRCQREADGARPATDAVEARLHHTHLPTLEDAGVVEYDPRSETVRYRGDDLLEAILDHVREKERSEQTN